MVTIETGIDYVSWGPIFLGTPGTLTIKVLPVASTTTPSVTPQPKPMVSEWETDFLPVLVLTRRRRSTGKNQYW